MKTLMMVMGMTIVACGDDSSTQGPAIAEQGISDAPAEAAAKLEQIAQKVDAEVDAELARRAQWVPTAAETKEVRKSRCLKAARKLIKHGEQCGVGMSKYRADRICAELLILDKLTDERAVGRLRTIMENGCRNVQLAVKYERI
jgi:hypothetical protein